MAHQPDSDTIRTYLAANPEKRPRDAADSLGISEAALLDARTGHGATRITAHPDHLIPAAERLGEVMALTRNDACVHEKIGEYGDYHSGDHAAMTLAENVDLRIFPAHWVHGFAVETGSDSGPRRSLQVFDAAGDAVHKIHLRDTSDHEAWAQVVTDLAPDAPAPDYLPRQPAEAPKSRPEKAEILRAEWRKLTDTHQFLRLCSKLKMNRLGAYRIAGAPFVRALDVTAADTMLETLARQGTEVMIFVGNRGCIQIHTGSIHDLRPMGPWQNVIDPGFNLHLRRDRLAEVWAVEKPTQRGPAVSVEAFDADGGLIFQVFGVGKEGRDSRPAWARIVEALPATQEAPA